MPHPEDKSEEENDYLKKEKEEDPMGIAKEHLALGRELLDSLKRDRAMIGPPCDAMPPVLHLVIQPIENGILIHRVQLPAGYAPVPSVPGVKIDYAPDQAAVEGRVVDALRSFLSGYGTPGPEAGKAPPEASTGGPLLGPLEP